MPEVDDRFDHLVETVGVAAAKEALDDVVKAGPEGNFDGRAVMLKAGLTAIHGDGAYRRAVIQEFIEHLSVQENDVLIVHMGADDPEDDEAMNAWMTIAHSLAARLREQGTNVTVVLASQTGRIEDIPEQVMVRKGWIRAARLRSVTKGEWGEKVDAAAEEGDPKMVSGLFWDFYNQVEAFASGVAVEEELATEDELRTAARPYFGGVKSILGLLAYLKDADAEDFKQWQEQAGEKLTTDFEKGLARYRPLVDPEWEPAEPDDEEGADDGD